MWQRCRPRKRRGFTLIEIMIVVLIIGILLGVAVPSFVQAREGARTKACVKNLSQLRWAKEQWAIENGKGPSDTPAEADIAGSFKYLSSLPVCPSSGAYTLNDISKAPTCSHGGAHKID